MISWLSYKLKRFYLSYYIKFKKYSVFKTPYQESGHEKLCAAICRETINHIDSKFSIAPIANKRYIVNKTLDIFIILEDSRIEITNHVYHYDVFLNEKQMTKLINHYDNKVDQLRLEYEDQIKSQIKNTLQSIYQNIKKSN